MVATSLFLVASGAAPARAQDVARGPTLSDIPAEVLAVLRAYERGWEARDASGLAALFSEDGWALRPGTGPVRGRDAIEQTYEGLGGPLVLRPYHFESEGAVGFLIGGFARSADEPDVGKFVLALRRGGDGAWHIVADIDNGN